MTDSDPHPQSSGVRPAAADERFHRRRFRQIIAAFSTLALVGGLGGGLVAIAPAARAFASTLDPSRLSDLAGPTGTGVRLGDLDPDQRAAALAIIETALSPEGMTQLQEAMRADDELDAAAGGGSGWGTDDYTVALLAEPDADAFFFQLGGRQLAVNAIYRDGRLTVEPELLDT